MKYTGGRDPNIPPPDHCSWLKWTQQQQQRHGTMNIVLFPQNKPMQRLGNLPKINYKLLLNKGGVGIPNFFGQSRYAKKHVTNEGGGHM